MKKYEIVMERFIQEMGYQENEHVLGAFFYGSYLTGLQHEGSDIDMHIVFDNTNPLHLIRANKHYEDIKIEYFEKPLQDLYLSVENAIRTRNVAWLSILGTSKILFDKKEELQKLQNYTLEVYEEPLEKLDENQAKEYVSIINNRIEKLEKSLEEHSLMFTHLYHVTLEKIRKFYHELNGLACISTSKVERIYTDEEYRLSYKGFEIPKKTFIEMYLDACYDITSSDEVKLQKVQELWNYAKRDIDLEQDYRILIRSRNI